MDWTGGTRRRYAPKGRQDEATQKQKAHFAKMRAAADAQVATVLENLQHAEESKQYRPVMSSQQDAVVAEDKAHSRHTHSHESIGRNDRSSRHYRDSDREKHSRHSKHSRSSKRERTSDRKRSKHKLLVHRTANMTEEERLLLANRERLLERHDWLGLAASRPVSYRFPSRRDEDKIGKRRRIHKPRSHKSRPKEPTPLVPLFGETLQNTNHLMSGAMPSESMNIKIGTDAFASQTQPSQHARTPVNTSLRHISTDLGHVQSSRRTQTPVDATIRHASTDFGPLSEQPMLVSVDENGFERHGDSAFSGYPDNITTRAPTEPGSYQVDSYADATQGTFPSFAAQVETPLRRLLLPVEESFEDLEAGSTPDRSTELAVRLNRFERAQHEDRTSGYLDLPDPHIEDDEDTSGLMRRYERLTAPDPPAVPAASSSRYATWAGTSLQPQSTEGLLIPPEQLKQAIEAQGDEVIQSELSNIMSSETDSMPDPLDPDAISRRVEESAHRVHEERAVDNLQGTHTRQDEEARDNELWKQFVFGSQSSDSGPSETTRKTIGDLWQDTEPVQSAYSRSTRMSTDAPRSDRATVGRTGFSGETSDRDTTSDAHANTSMIAEATTIHPGNGDSEYIHQIDDGATYTDGLRSFTTGNIHASSTMTRKRRRSTKTVTKKRQRTLANPPQYETLTRTKTYEQPRSVFDFGEDE